MLYLTTRNRTDTFTAHRALHEPSSPDGGAFLPIRFPEYTREEIEQLKQVSFSQAVAQQLNRFFSVSITGWDVEFAIGKNPFSMISFGRKLYCGRLWHNEKRNVDHLLGRIYALLRKQTYTGQVPAGWAALSIRIALMFGLTAELMRKEITQFDVAVCADDFDAIMAVWYARRMGLPVGTVICGCSGGSDLWDLIHKGESNASALRSMPGVEKLIYSTLGLNETLRYLNAKGVYKVDESSLCKVNKGLFAAVIGKKRMESVINSLYKTDSVIADPELAVAYSAMQDHRAKTGESRPTLLLSTVAPELCKDIILPATGLKITDLKKYSEMP